MTYQNFVELVNEEMQIPFTEDCETFDMFLTFLEYYFKRHEALESLEEFIIDAFGSWSMDTHGNELMIYDRLNHGCGESPNFDISEDGRNGLF